MNPKKAHSMKLFKLLPALLLLAAPAALARPGEYNFRVEIDGADAGQFTAVDGLSIEIEVVEYQDGTDPILRKRPGRTKYSNITLKRGYVSSNELWDWVQATRTEAAGYKKPVSLVLLDADTSTEVARYNFFECWPAKWKVGALDGTASNVMTEEITVVTEHIVYAPGAP